MAHRKANEYTAGMKRILILNTGGTIAMDLSSGEAEFNASKWSETLYREVPELSEIAEIEIEQLFLEDSSDIHREHWSTLIGHIASVYDSYDGFVILHGTDTMAYTASALSFGLQNLAKPVILTGSQVPMSNIRSDARRNLVNSIEMATLPLEEVAICFNDFVFRGNRATKMSIGDFNAFASPNFPPLAEIGLNIEIRESLSTATSGKGLQTSGAFSDRVFLLKIFPNLDPRILQQLDPGSFDALIVEAFGSGNVPLKGDRSLFPFFSRCLEEGVIIALTSQAPYDAVDLSNYESGRKVREMGAVGAGDMTSEAALTKMMYLLGTCENREEIKKRFRQNMAGEITE